MKRLLLLATLVAISTIGAQAHIGWDLAGCIQRYGDESKPLKKGNAGDVHYFAAGDMTITVILRNDKVKSISYRHISGKTFSADETDVLQKKNQAELLGCEGIEWVANPKYDSLNGPHAWSLSRQGASQLQTVLKNTATSEKPDFVLTIRTWDQIPVDQAGSKQDQLDMLRNL